MVSESSTLPFSVWPLVRLRFQPGAEAPIGGLDIRGSTEVAVAEAAIPALVERVQAKGQYSPYYHLPKLDPQHQRAAIADAVRHDLSRINETLTDGFDTLAYAIAHGLEQVRRLGQDQLKRLDEIAELLEAPLDTAAMERRRRGIRGYSNGLLEEAETDLRVAVEQNPYDHISWLHLGHLGLRLENIDGAIVGYEKAIRYSKADGSDVINGYAHLGLSRALQETGDLALSRQAAAEAESLLGSGGWQIAYEQARIARRLDLDPSEHVESVLKIAPILGSILLSAESPPIEALSATKQVACLAYDLGSEISNLSGLEPPSGEPGLLEQIGANCALVSSALDLVEAELHTADEALQRANSDERSREDHKTQMEIWEKKRSTNQWDIVFVMVKWAAIASIPIGFILGFSDPEFPGNAFLAGLAGAAMTPLAVAMGGFFISPALWLFVAMFGLDRHFVPPPKQIHEVLSRGTARAQSDKQSTQVRFDRLEALASHPLAGSELLSDGQPDQSR